MKERHLSTSIFSFTVHEKAFQRLSCTVIGKGDISNIVQNLIINYFSAARYQFLHGTVSAATRDLAPIAQSVSALDFKFERAVEGSILTAGKRLSLKI